MRQAASYKTQPGAPSVRHRRSDSVGRQRCKDAGAGHAKVSVPVDETKRKWGAPKPCGRLEMVTCVQARHYLAGFKEESEEAPPQRETVFSWLAKGWTPEEVERLLWATVHAAMDRPGDFVPGRRCLPPVGAERVRFFQDAGFGSRESAMLGTVGDQRKGARTGRGQTD